MAGLLCFGALGLYTVHSALAVAVGVALGGAVEGASWLVAHAAHAMDCSALSTGHLLVGHTC
jgi:hypothetical protein